jgi:hypothetical protein
MNIAEIRKFSNTGYFQSQPVTLGGLASFLAVALINLRGNGELFYGNLDDVGKKGWGVSILGTNDSLVANYTVTFKLYEGGVLQQATATFFGALGKTVILHTVYTGEFQQIWLNGCLVSLVATAGDPFAASTLRFGIGNNPNAPTMTGGDAAGFVGFGFMPLGANGANTIASNTLEIGKRGDMTDGGLDGLFTYAYSIQNAPPVGQVPSSVPNLGSVGPTGNLTTVGRNTLEYGAPPYFWGDPTAVGTGATPIVPLTNPLDIYVASTGSDTNDGLSPATPVLTMAGAYSKIVTPNLAAPVRIHVADFSTSPAPCVWSPIPDYLAHNDAGQIIIIGDGAGQAGQNGFAVLTEGASGAGTSAAEVHGTFGSPNSFQGYAVQFTTGAAAGQRRLIRDNTATVLIPTALFDPAPAPGDHFQVIAPLAAFEMAGAPLDFAAGSSLSYPTLINCVFLNGTNSPLRVDSVACAKFYGVFFFNGSELSVSNSQLFAGVTPDFGINDIHFAELQAALATSPVPAGDPAKWTGYGCSTPDGHLNDLNYPWDAVAGTFVSIGALLMTELGDAAIDARLFGGFFGGMHVEARGHIKISLGTIPLLVPFTGETSAAMDIYGPDITVLGGDVTLELDVSLFSTATNVGLRVQGGSNLYWFGGWQIEAGVGQLLVVQNANGTIDLEAQPFALALHNNALGLCAGFGGSLSIQDQNNAGSVNVTTDGSGGTGVFALGGNISFNRMNTASSPAFRVPYNVTGGEADVFGVVAREQASVDLGVVTITQALVGLLSTVQSKLGAAAVAITNTFNGVVAVSFGEMVLGQLDASCTDAAITCSASSRMVAPATTGISSSAANAAVLCGTQSELLLSGPISSTKAASVGLLIADGGEVSSSSNITGVGAAVSIASGEFICEETAILTATAGTAVLASLGGQVTFLAGTSGSTQIHATADGIDCTGGGQAYFASAALIAFVVTGNQCVVGPAGGEKSTFAAAMPTPGSSFSNTGRGTSMTRNL